VQLDQVRQGDSFNIHYPEFTVLFFIFSGQIPLLLSSQVKEKSKHSNVSQAKQGKVTEPSIPVI